MAACSNDRILGQLIRMPDPQEDQKRVLVAMFLDLAFAISVRVQ